VPADTVERDPDNNIASDTDAVLLFWCVCQRL
jgi:hypothetical protein